MLQKDNKKEELKELDTRLDYDHNFDNQFLDLSMDNIYKQKSKNPITNT